MKSGWEFPNLSFISEYVPLVHDDARHAELRRLAAEHLKKVSKEFPAMRQRIIKQLRARLATGGEIEVMSEIVWPAVAEVMDVFSGLAFVQEASLAIAGEMSLKKIRILEGQLAEMVAMARERFPEETDGMIGMRLSFATVGAEPLAGTLGVSLDHVFKSATGQKISTLDWPEEYPATGVPNVIKSTYDIKGADLGEDQTGVCHIFLDMTAFLKSNDSKDRRGIFGFGKHACIGRPFSTLMWQDVVSEMKATDARVEYLGMSPSTHSVFDVPNAINIRVTHD